MSWPSLDSVDRTGPTTFAGIPVLETDGDRAGMLVASWQHDPHPYDMLAAKMQRSSAELTQWLTEEFQRIGGAGKTEVR